MLNGIRTPKILDRLVKLKLKEKEEIHHHHH